jgi:hypothetical protein
MEREGMTSGRGSEWAARRQRPRQRRKSGLRCSRPFRLFLCIAAGLLSAGLRAAPPSPTPPNTAAAGGWSAWGPVGRPTFVAPSLAINAATGTLELAIVRPDLHVDHFRQNGGTWSGPVSPTPLTSLPTSLMVDAVGTPQLLLTGPSADVMNARFLSGAWQVPLSTGVSSFFPPAAAVNPTGNIMELATVGLDGGVRHSRFINGAWRTLATLNAVSFMPPTLIANPAGGLELAIIGLDRQIYHAHYGTNGWSAFEATAVFSDMTPAMAVGADGTLHLAATQLDRSVVEATYANGAWSGPTPTGLQSDLSPTLVSNRGAGSLELLARDLARVLQHGRFVSGDWQSPVALGITTVARPALVAGSGGALDAALVGTDGRVYVSHFAGAQSAVSTSVSFAKDIVRIFTNNGSKTCARGGCHSGSRPARGINLEASEAYSTVVDGGLVTPGDPDSSDLFQQVDSGRMPQSGGRLSSADIELLRQWILAGAPNN